MTKASATKARRRVKVKSLEGDGFHNSTFHLCIMSEPRKRFCYVGVPDMFNLNHAVKIINEAFDEVAYHVGSSLERKDYRDVDVRMILADEKFDEMFPGEDPDGPFYCAKLSLMNVVFSEYLKSRTGLPIDFQFQRRTNANRDYPGAGKRNALGICLRKERPVSPNDNDHKSKVEESR